MIILTKNYIKYKKRYYNKFIYCFHVNFSLIPIKAIKGMYIGCKNAQTKYDVNEIVKLKSLDPKKTTKPSKINFIKKKLMTN